MTNINTSIIIVVDALHYVAKLDKTDDYRY